MKVLVMPADEWACGHYRLAWPANCLQMQGYDIQVVAPNQRSGFRIKTARQPDGSETIVEMDIPEADVIVIQRPARPLMVQLIEILRANGIAVVAELDDDLTNLHPGNIAYNVYKPGSPSGMSWRYTIEACKQATYVITSTQRLQHIFARHGRGQAIDNYVPEVYLNFEHYDTGFFGWAGTTKSHPDDLSVLGHAVPILIDRGFRYQGLGGTYGLEEALHTTTPISVLPAVPLQQWAQTMTQAFDVSLCPLSDTAFNASKSRLKAIEAMAVGLAWVASPREEYRRLQRESGVGFLANNPQRWVKCVSELMSNDALRREQAEAGREYMKTQTYQANAWRWMEAWEQALKIQRGGAS